MEVGPQNQDHREWGRASVCPTPVKPCKNEGTSSCASFKAHLPIHKQSSSVKWVKELQKHYFFHKCNLFEKELNINEALEEPLKDC